MEHIVQFAIGIDDEAIRNRVTESAEKQITESIKRDVEGTIFCKEWHNNNVDKKQPEGMGKRHGQRCH